MLDAIEIWKSYSALRSLLALDNVSLAVKRGEIAGLLGASGAGKTTTLSILSTLMRPDHGRVLIDGSRPDPIQTDSATCSDWCRSHSRSIPL